MRRIELADLRAALEKGLDDFRVFRTDVVFLCVVYPLAGLALAWFAFQRELLPLLFPLVSGFALIGPVAAIGLYELSRRREQGAAPSWADAFGMIWSPSFGAIAALGFALLAVFLVWLGVAQVIYSMTLGPEPPVSASAFAIDVLTTARGWVMMIIGTGVGALFAATVLAVSAISFPMLLDRDVGLRVAVTTSVRAVVRNPVTMAAWGLTVAGALALGALPFLLGLMFVMPVLGHATWHLYRRLVV